MFKKNKSKSNKISLSELVWIGFSFTASGVTFTSAFAGIISNSNTGIGWWIFLVILLGALFIGATSWAFKKCSSFYKNDSNGGAYIYVRSSYGRFWGWIIGFIQYVTLPTSLIVCIIALVDQDIGYLIPQSTPLIGNGDRYQHLFLNIIGILIFSFASLIIYFGLKWLKVCINISSILQWMSSLIIICCGIYIFIGNGFNNFSLHISDDKMNHFNILNFNNAEITFIYFFVGFETYACMSKNLKNPEKNIGKAIMWVLFLVTMFYMIVTFIFIGAIGVEYFANNSTQSGIKYGANPSLFVASKALGVTGVIIIVVSIFATKLNSIIQSSLYSGTMLEPLAIEGYISPKISKLRKNIPFSASLTNTIITILISFVILVIPNFFISDIDFSNAVAFSSLFSVIIYISVVLCALKLYLNKKIKLNIFEIIIFMIALIALSWLVVSYFLNLFIQIFRNVLLVVNLCQLILLIVLTSFSIIWYYSYYNPIYKKRLLENPELQIKLNKQFSFNEMIVN